MTRPTVSWGRPQIHRDRPSHLWWQLAPDGLESRLSGRPDDKSRSCSLENPGHLLLQRWFYLPVGEDHS